MKFSTKKSEGAVYLPQEWNWRWSIFLICGTDESDNE